MVRVRSGSVRRLHVVRRAVVAQAEEMVEAGSGSIRRLHAVGRAVVTQVGPAEEISGSGK